MSSIVCTKCGALYLSLCSCLPTTSTARMAEEYQQYQVRMRISYEIRNILENSEEPEVDVAKFIQDYLKQVENMFIDSHFYSGTDIKRYLKS